MAPPLCAICVTDRALIRRPKNHQKLCKTCFISVFEDEVHHTITSSQLFYPGEKVAIGASGGKDSTVLAAVLKTLNERHKYGLELVLLSVDEGIQGYRDDSLETVKRNAIQYDMPLQIVGYSELYGWTMDQVVEAVGKKGNCTYCGVFRRQALDRGAKLLGIRHVVTGHNADDVAETVLMNLLRGDLPRLSRSTSIVTGGDNRADVKRSKPLKYAYEKEIVLYAHHRKLDYFSTECLYSPEAFRGSARSLIKNLERVRPSAILDIVRSGEDMARLVPGADYASSSSCTCAGSKTHKAHGCGTSRLSATNTRCDDAMKDLSGGSGGCGRQLAGATGNDMEPQRKTNEAAEALETDMAAMVLPRKPQYLDGDEPVRRHPAARGNKSVGRQVLGTCEKCGYMSSQTICQACTLLEGLNKNRPQINLL